MKTGWSYIDQDIRIIDRDLFRDRIWISQSRKRTKTSGTGNCDQTNVIPSARRDPLWIYPTSRSCFKNIDKDRKQLETHSEESFAKVWQQTAEQKLKQVIYEPKFYEILKNMGETIGYLDQQMQEKTILLTIEQLDDKIFLMKDQVVKNCKMYRSLGISLSVLIVIILL